MTSIILHRNVNTANTIRMQRTLDQRVINAGTNTASVNDKQVMYRFVNNINACNVDERGKSSGG